MSYSGKRPLLLSLCLLFLALALAPHNAQAHLRYFLQPADIQGSSTPYGDNEKAGHYVQSHDASIYYEVYGQGRPLVVLHGGLLGSPYELGCLIDRLRSSFQVIVITSRGHGRSGMGKSPISLTQKAQDVLAVMHDLGCQRAAFLGFSDGAYTAYAVAREKPDAVERLVAIGAGSVQEGQFPPTLAIEDLEKLDAAYMEQMRKIMPEAKLLNTFANNYMAFWNRQNLDQNFFAGIHCPVLLVSGDRDDHAPLHTMLKAHKSLPNSRLCVVPNASHRVFLDNFPMTWLAVFDFLKTQISELTRDNKSQ